MNMKSCVNQAAISNRWTKPSKKAFRHTLEIQIKSPYSTVTYYT